MPHRHILTRPAQSTKTRYWRHLSAYDAGMTEEGPWQRYDGDKLRKGWAHPLGRDEVSAALVAAGASPGSLSFSRTEPNKPAGLRVLHAY